MISGLNNDTNSSDWVCKCYCVSKRAHRSRWAFISNYKKLNNNKTVIKRKITKEIPNKYSCESIESISDSELELELESQTPNNDQCNKANKFICKKVRYCPELQKIMIVDIDINNDNDLNNRTDSNSNDKATGVIPTNQVTNQVTNPTKRVNKKPSKKILELRDLFIQKN